MKERLGRWTRILAAYFGSQSAVQLLGILAGILFVRYMPVREFALYTLAMSVVTFFMFLTDLGATGSLVHFFQRTVGGEGDFERYVEAVFSVRRWGYWIGAVVVIVGFPWAALTDGHDPSGVALATVAILAAAWFQILATVRLLVLRLRDRYRESYRAEIAGGVLRVLLAGALIALAFVPAWAAAASGALATAVVALLANDRGRNRDQGAESGPSPERRQVLRYLLPTLPSGLYFAFQGTLVVWLASAFGQSRNVAEVGALSRLGLVVGLFSGLTGVVFLPRLARITEDRLYLRRMLQFGAALVAVAFALLIVAKLAPAGFLWVLGENYSGLDHELALIVAGAGVSLVGGYLVAVNMARSWNRWQGAAAGVLALAQVALAFSTPLHTVSGILRFNLYSAAVGLALQAAITVTGFRRPRYVEWTA